jgi:ubiquinone/menaquinone biosynthesis C-methylase UbiE
MFRKNKKAEVFNRKASSNESKPDEILKVLDIKKGQNIADIGSGGGYFAIRFAEIVGENGIVYAIDINKEFLSFVTESAKEKGFENIKPILYDGKKPNLPEKSLDLIFIRNTYHHISDRVEYFRNASRFLKPNGKIVIIENKKGNFNFHSLFGHFVDKKIIIKEMEDAGYVLEKEYEFLPKQCFLIFLPKAV